MRQSMNKYYSDYYRMTGNIYKPGFKSFLRRCDVCLTIYSLLFILENIKNIPVLLSRLILYRLSRKYGLEISTNAQIGEGIYLGHPYNITVGE